MTTNPIPEPDTKDWTWVLAQSCPECGFTASDIDGPAIGETVRELAPRWVTALARPDARERPAPTTWSTLEYGAHVRDVLRIFDGRLELLLTQDGPQFENWDQDATALADRYDLQDPAIVSTELVTAADTVASRFDSVAADQWDRSGTRSNGSQFTVLTLGQYFLHDVIHHTNDVRA